ncbi:MAG: hypothetical protein PHO63_01545 [Bacilli bacterium]|nr:hypothetical protein [Bacilli bacterium]MDD4808560.1 hypothetical protein [Bacilli bacterium]
MLKKKLIKYVSNARGVVRSVKYEYKRLEMIGETNQEIVFTFEDGEESSNVVGAKLKYDGQVIQNGLVKINEDGKVALAIYTEDWCAVKKFNTDDITVTPFNGDNNCQVQQKVDISGANKPKLVTGMTPITWDGNSWVEASNVNDPYEQNWYDYQNKKWANAKTADGSFWVWIPRYAYSIKNGYHTSTAGTIDIKFLKDKTNNAADMTIIELKPTYSGSSQTNFVLHPAFEFDGETTGFWIAKFEPSVADQNDLCYKESSVTYCNKTTLVPKIIPNAEAWIYITIGNSFDIAFNMKNNPIYGWSANDVDTYMIKNDEWGAVAYLSKSRYGKETEEVFKNNSTSAITGCAENIGIRYYDGCQNEYHTTNGVKASTTGTIYGVYDMSGGFHEYVAAYINNGNNYLKDFGQNILDAPTKYKNIYITGTTDTSENNYNANKNVIGDAIYETSSMHSDANGSWYSDYSYMPYIDSPWFSCGGYWYDGYDSAGVFGFYNVYGNGYSISTFRPVVRPVA